MSEAALLAHETLHLGFMINRSYPGFADWCWPDSLNIRRIQLGTSPVFCRWSVRFVTAQHWCRCPELYLQLGRIRFDLLLPAGMLPSWAPQISWAHYLR